jgi:hypothetical protein
VTLSKFLAVSTSKRVHRKIFKAAVGGAMVAARLAAVKKSALFKVHFVKIPPFYAAKSKRDS